MYRRRWICRGTRPGAWLGLDAPRQGTRCDLDAWPGLQVYYTWPCRRAGRVYSTGATKLIGLVGGGTERSASGIAGSDSDELNSKDGR
jgi:hypothetical protein